MPHRSFSTCVSLVGLFRYIYVSSDIQVHAKRQLLVSLLWVSFVGLFCGSLFWVSFLGLFSGSPLLYIRLFVHIYTRLFWYTCIRQTSAPQFAQGAQRGSLLWVFFVDLFSGSLFWVSSAIYTSLCTGIINMLHHGFAICARWSTCVSILGLFVGLFCYTYVSFDTHLNATP